MGLTQRDRVSAAGIVSIALVLAQYTTARVKGWVELGKSRHHLLTGTGKYSDVSSASPVIISQSQVASIAISVSATALAYNGFIQSDKSNMLIPFILMSHLQSVRECIKDIK